MAAESALNEWLVAVLAGVVGYTAARIQHHLARSEQRPIVATALQTEIQSLEISLRRLAKHSQAARSTLWPSVATFSAHRGDLVLFDKSLARDLIVFYGLVSEINDSRARIAQSGVNISDDAHKFVRVKAIAAANHIPSLRKRLSAQGGTEVPDSGDVWTDMSVEPELAAAAFPTTRRVTGA